MLFAEATDTETCDVPPEPSRAAGTVAVNRLSEPGVVVRAVVVVPTFHCTVPLVRPLPLTVKVKSEAAGAWAEMGERERTWGPVKVKFVRTRDQAPRP